MKTSLLVFEFGKPLYVWVDIFPVHGRSTRITSLYVWVDIFSVHGRSTRITSIHELEEKTFDRSSLKRNIVDRWVDLNVRARIDDGQDSLPMLVCYVEKREYFMIAGIGKCDHVFG